ncbi:MAG: gamma-glutamylcyclotransferase [FCB group bacterium]
MEDKFFTQSQCDRCGNNLYARIMSFFTTETICLDCSLKEDELKQNLPDGGKSYEGCGYIPNINEKGIRQ